MESSVRGTSHFLWSSGCDAASSPVEEVGPAPVFEAAFDGEQDVAPAFDQWASGPLEAAADDLLADAFRRRIRRQSEFPAEVVAHSAVRSCTVAAAQGMEQVEDEDQCPSGENLLARGSDPLRSVGHHRHQHCRK